MLDVLANINWVVILGALFAVSEALALIPAVKANSVFQFIANGIKSLKDRFVK